MLTNPSTFLLTIYILSILGVTCPLKSAEGAEETNSLPPTPLEQYDRGRELYLTLSRNGLSKAIELYNKAIEQDREFAPAYSGLSEAHIYLGHLKYTSKENYEPEFTKAYTLLLTALKLSEDSLETQRALALNYLMLKRKKDTKSAANRALEIEPDDPESLYILWAASGAKVDDPLIKKALKKNSELPIAIIGLGRSYARREDDYKKSIEYYKKALEISPDMAYVYNLMGDSYINIAEYSKALEAFEKAAEIEPANPLAHLNVGKALGRMGRTRDSIEPLKKATSLNPGFPETYYHLARALQGVNEKNEAAETYKKFIRLASFTGYYEQYVALAEHTLKLMGNP